MSDQTALLRGLRVLIAEDESLIALDLESTLTLLGCDVVGTVSRLEEVLPIAKRERIDGAVLDVNIRGRQVFEILPELLAMSVKVILTSGYDNPIMFPEAFRDLPRVPKPFNEDVLRDTCARVFGRQARRGLPADAGSR